MPTKAELEARIARDLARKDLEAVPFAQIIAALENADQNDATKLRDDVRQRRSQAAGSALIGIVIDHIATQRGSEAATMLADDALDLDELSRWLD